MTGHGTDVTPDGGSDYVAVTAAGQLFGVPIERVRDVFTVSEMTPVPLGPPEIVGLLNLRGRIATAIDLRRRLGLSRAEGEGLMAVGIEANGESYGLIVEGIREVIRLGRETRDQNPAHLSGAWSALSSCVHRLDGELLVVLDVDAVLDIRMTQREPVGAVP